MGNSSEIIGTRFQNLRLLIKEQFGDSNLQATVWEYLPNMKYWVVVRTWALWYAQSELTGIGVFDLFTDENSRVQFGDIVKKSSGKSYAIFPKGYLPNIDKYEQL